VATYTKGAAAVKARCAADGEEAEEAAPYCEGFGEANMKHAINGYMYDNNPYLTMKVPCPLLRTSGLASARETAFARLKEDPSGQIDSVRREFRPARLKGNEQERGIGYKRRGRGNTEVEGEEGTRKGDMREQGRGRGPKPHVTPPRRSPLAQHPHGA
jgi:hypothetical protein